MSLTLAMVVLVTTILVFFSKEFSGINKKLLAIPGFKLLAPLLIASIVVEMYEPFFAWLLLQTKEGMHYIYNHLIEWMPVKSHLAASSFILFLLAMIPFVSFALWDKWRKMTFIRPITYRVSLITWILAAIVLTVYRP